jgi:hypothetical protein
VKRTKSNLKNATSIKKVFLMYILIIVLFISALNISITKIAFAGPFSESDYYLSDATGNDGNDGHFGNPWKTLEHAISMTDSGDILYIMAGTYTPTGQIDIWNKGTNGQWYTIRNYNNDEVIIQGTNCPKSDWIDAVLDFHECNYVRISGLTITHSARCGITFRSDCTTHLMVDNCSITDNAQCAIKALTVNNLTIEHNYISNNMNNWSGIKYSDDEGLGQETVSIESSTDIFIANNTLKGNRMINIDIKSGCNRGIICYNTINTTALSAKDANGITMWGEAGIYIDARGIIKNFSIYNNLIYGNNTGIDINNEGSAGHYEYIQIYNNVINITKEPFGAVSGYYTGRSALYIGNEGESSSLYHHIFVYSNSFHTGIDDGYSVLQIGNTNNGNAFNSENLQNVYIVNNIFTTSETVPRNLMRFAGITFSDGLDIFSIKNNCFYRASGSISVYWGTTTYTPSTSAAFGEDPLFANPSFIDYSDQYGNFRLSENSPCINTGDNTLFPAYDFDVVSRPQGSVVDSGAFEFVLGGGDVFPPQISSITVSTSNPIDTQINFGWENFSVIVTDNVGVSTVTLHFTNPDNSVTNIAMTKKIGTNTYYSNRSFSLDGNYHYVIQAIDTNGNSKSSQNYLFWLPPNWDVNSDGSCTVLDIVLVSNRYNNVGGNGWVREDFDNNGVVNILDMSMISRYFA